MPSDLLERYRSSLSGRLICLPVRVVIVTGGVGVVEVAGTVEVAGGLGVVEVVGAVGGMGVVEVAEVAVAVDVFSKWAGFNLSTETASVFPRIDSLKYLSLLSNTL